MKKSDIYLVTIMYAIIAAFFYMTMQLKVDARIYPLMVMAIFFILVTMHLIKCCIEYSKTKVIENDIPVLFADMVPKQFVGIIILSFLFVIFINILGFYPSAIIYLISVLAFLKVPRKQIAITTVFFAVLIYGVFTMFLNVPLPTGMFF